MNNDRPAATRPAATRRRLLLGSAASLTLAACATPGQAPTAPAQAATGRVEFWQLYQNSPAAAPIKELFQKKHPNIQVEWIDTAAGQQPDKLTVASAGGVPPDMTSITAPFFRDVARFYQPLDQYLKRDAKKIDSDDFLPIWTQGSVIKGKTMGLPLEIAARVWWFNRSLFQERGLPFPTRQGAPAKLDYRAVEEMGQKLTFTRGDKQVYGFFVTRDWFNILIYVYAFGGKFLDDDHTKCLLDSPQAAAGIEYAQELVTRRQYAPSSGTVDVHDQENTVGMYYHNAARAQNLRRVPNGQQWDVGPVVTGPTGVPVTFAFIHQVGVVKDSKNPEAAWTIAAEYSGKDATPYWMEHHGWPTARKSYLERYIKAGTPPPDTRQNVLEWIKVSPVATFPVGYTANVAPVASRLIAELNSGQRAPRDVATALGREITPVLEK